MELKLNIPDKFVEIQSVESLIFDLKLNTAIEKYKNSEITAAAAAEFVGNIDREEFLQECIKRHIEPQTYTDIDELHDELNDIQDKLS